MEPRMAHPPDHESSFYDNFLDYHLQVLLEWPDNSDNHPSSIFTAIEASMRFCAVRSKGGSAITRRQPIPCGATNSNDITNISSTSDYGISVWIYNFSWCDVAGRLEILSVIRSRISFVSYCIPYFVDI
jgi:hypothetical protein